MVGRKTEFDGIAWKTQAVKGIGIVEKTFSEFLSAFAATKPSRKIPLPQYFPKYLKEYLDLVPLRHIHRVREPHLISTKNIMVYSARWEPF